MSSDADTGRAVLSDVSRASLAARSRPTAGTDHGWGGVHFTMGGGVAGAQDPTAASRARSPLRERPPQRSAVGLRTTSLLHGAEHGPEAVWVLIHKSDLRYGYSTESPIHLYLGSYLFWRFGSESLRVYP